MQMPIGAEEHFEGVIDLIKMKAIIWDMESQGMKFEYRDIPANLKDAAKKARELHGGIGGRNLRRTDEQVLRRRGDLSEEEIISGLRAGTLDQHADPGVLRYAFKNKGVQAHARRVISCCRRRPIVRRSKASTRTITKPAVKRTIPRRSPRSRSRS
jgi:elongation factor G